MVIRINIYNNVLDNCIKPYIFYTCVTITMTSNIGRKNTNLDGFLHIIEAYNSLNLNDLTRNSPKPLTVDPSLTASSLSSFCLKPVSKIDLPHELKQANEMMNKKIKEISDTQLRRY